MFNIISNIIENGGGGSVILIRDNTKDSDNDYPTALIISSGLPKRWASKTPRFQCNFLIF
jgi:hypothetical protein